MLIKKLLIQNRNNQDTKAFGYFDAQTGKRVHLVKGAWGSERNMPDYVFRYLTRGASKYESSLSLPGLQIGSKGKQEGKGSNFTQRKQRSPRKV